MDEREWAICEPLLPFPAWLAGKAGRPSSYCMRDIVDGIRYLAYLTRNRPVWRALPAGFPARRDHLLLGRQMAGRRLHRDDA
jgi:transposase